MNKLLFLLICLTPFLQIYTQQIGTWRNYTNMQTVNGALATNNGIWAATTGGAFFYNVKNNTYETLTKAEGLGNNILTAIAQDKYGKVWFGSQDGIIDVYDSNTKQFVKRILDIYNSSKTTKTINDFKITGDTVFVSTDFGLSLIDAKTFFFYDTFIKLGNLISDTKVNSSYLDKLLFVATDNGIAKQKQGATNLSAPESWENFNTTNGLPSNSINTFKLFRDTLIVSTSSGLAYFNGNSWNRFLPQLNNYSITDIKTRNDSLFILSNNQIYIYNNGKLEQPYPALTSGLGIELSENEVFTFGTNGIAEINNSSVEKYYVPNGPSSNYFYGIAVDKNGYLWGGSGSGGSATGFYKYDGVKWTNYTKDDIPNARYNQIFKVYVDPDNTVYLLTWGDGFIKYKDGKFKIYNADNTGLVGISTDLKYVIVEGLANDTQGNLWILTYLSSNKQPLAVLKSDSTWQLYSNVLTNQVIKGYDLTVDQYDTKWMIIGDEESSGGTEIFYFNSSKPIYSGNINGWGFINSANGLNSGGINSIVIDRRGELWIGTTAGINVITDTRDPNRISGLRLLNSQIITYIAVDALNQKWVGTQQGVYVVSSDGSAIIANYNSSNSPLPADVIRSIAIDNNSGKVYFGTDYGLASLNTSSIYPKDNFGDIIVSPNPVILNNKNINITIDGLIRDSDIKILTLTGKMVAEFSSPGGRIAAWDGKNQDGNYVNSGIYLIIAYDKEGNNVGIGKIAVIKK
jgi:ligand-binding sensor domain-containing protein